MDRQKTIRIVAVVLAVLLLLGVTALAIVLLSRTGGGSDTSKVSDNGIYPTASDEGSVALYAVGYMAAASETVETDETDETGEGVSDDVRDEAVSLALHKKNADDNVAFNAVNMFPGDVETKYYCVKVSYKNEITVRFRAEVREGYEKLAEVMKCKVVLLTTGQTLYDGLMKDMPESLNHTLKTEESTTDELYYEITAYLDTSVGNEYQNKRLVADFKWWVEETGNLEPAPDTGDSTVLIVVSSAALLLLLLLFVKKRREERHESV